jgi:sugar phosphate isomerase/epimerase
MAEAGFDYIEWPMSRTVGEMDDAAYDALRRLADELSVTPEAWNVMLPGTLKIVGPEADHDAMAGYVDRAFARAAELGGKVVVFGSGGARAVPEGWDHEAAVHQFEAACRIAGEVAVRNGITIAIEPLRSDETNLVNTVAEGAAIVESVGHPAVRLLSDLYHVTEMHEPFADTGAAAAMLVHVHVAEPGSRALPQAGTADDTYDAYFSTLKGAGYDGRISMECRGATPEGAATALTYLRERWDAVS